MVSKLLTFNFDVVRHYVVGTLVSNRRGRRWGRRWGLRWRRGRGDRERELRGRDGRRERCAASCSAHEWRGWRWGRAQHGLDLLRARLLHGELLATPSVLHLQRAAPGRCGDGGETYGHGRVYTLYVTVYGYTGDGGGKIQRDTQKRLKPCVLDYTAYTGKETSTLNPEP